MSYVKSFYLAGMFLLSCGWSQGTLPVSCIGSPTSVSLHSWYNKYEPPMGKMIQLSRMWKSSFLFSGLSVNGVRVRHVAGIVIVFQVFATVLYYCWFQALPCLLQRLPSAGIIAGFWPFHAHYRSYPLQVENACSSVFLEFLFTLTLWLSSWP